jgi:ELWxxDGT repeat protein
MSACCRMRSAGYKEVNGVIFPRQRPTNGRELWNRRRHAFIVSRISIPAALGISQLRLTNAVTHERGRHIVLRARPTNGYELWKSDARQPGTACGDINPAGRSVTGFNEFMNLNGTLFSWQRQHQ